DLETLYQQKLAEADLVPSRSSRRQQARKRLAESGIATLPFYALVDFKAGIEGEQAGQIERMLEDAGLLDALVVRPDQVEAADNLLSDSAEGLSDCFLQAGADAASGPTLADWLEFDPLSVEEGGDTEGWRRAVELILRSVVTGDQDGEAGLLAEEGRWWHGLLVGQAGAGPATGFIGTANRRRLRRQELDALQARLEAAQAELARLEEQIGQNTAQLRELAGEQAQLLELGRATAVAAAEVERNRSEVERDRAEKLLAESQNRAREVRQLLNGLTSRIVQESRDLPGAAGDPRRLRNLLNATSHFRSECALLLQTLQGAGERWLEYQEALTGLEGARRSEELARQLQAESQGRYTQTQAELDELERTMQSADLQELIERLAQLRARRKELPEIRLDASVERGRADERSRNLTENLAQAQQTLQDYQQQRTAAQTSFSLRLAFYPMARLSEARVLAEREDYAKAAARLLTPPSGSNAPNPDEEQLEGEYKRTFNRLSIGFNQERPTLAEYGPELDDEGRVTFIVENRIEPPGLLELLSSQIEIQKTLLDNEERTLFEDFLLQEMAEAIRYHIGQTETWVRTINRLLQDLPMVGEHYSLEWKPTEESDFKDGLGSHVSRQQKLLRKPAQTLSTEETQILMDAFRREIEGLRLRQKEEPGLNFMDALVQIFDYREWFRFSVFITPTGGNRIRLNDRNAGSRSGAEQLFALYVPLFAALAALYDSSAEPGCPRLLALDEAFDKASVANTQRIMEFLVLQDFQWVMTGPQVSGTGSGVPVSAEYQMMHEKGSMVATAVPFFWIAGQEKTSEGASPDGAASNKI
ncbi:MAG: SbcC/MukB-like Walker B domain-containing protein, partial [Chloroflexota bacterium]